MLYNDPCKCAYITRRGPMMLQFSQNTSPARLYNKKRTDQKWSVPNSVWNAGVDFDSVHYEHNFEQVMILINVLNHMQR